MTLSHWLRWLPARITSRRTIKRKRVSFDKRVAVQQVFAPPSERLEDRALPAAVPQLININLVESGALHIHDDDIEGAGLEFAMVGSTLFFAADDEVLGRELWKTNGTPAGTMLVNDIFAAPEGEYDDFGSFPQNLTNVNGTLFFTADDGEHGRELWKSDGTATGTVLVRDIADGFYGSELNDFVSFNGMLLFSADDGVNGRQIWKSNGTVAGTVPLTNLQGEDGFLDSIEEVTVVGGNIFFVAADIDHGIELWKSNGTVAGTAMVKDINTQTLGGDGGYGGYGGYGGGEEPGSSFPMYLTNVNGTLFFAADNGLDGRELWKSNGTSSGTVQVKNIGPTISIEDPYYGESYDYDVGSYPANLVNVGGKLFFTANDHVKGRELWKSDGTSSGTLLVKEIRTGAEGAFPDEGPDDGYGGYPAVDPEDVDPSTFYTVVGTKLFFIANNGTNGYELWKSDGTSAGTLMVKDINPGAAGSFLGNSGVAGGNFTNVNGTLFFTADNGTNGYELWKSDGTGTNTVLVKDIFPNDDGDVELMAPTELFNLNNSLFFFANDLNSANPEELKLWKSDGSAAGTNPVPTALGTEGSNPAEFVNVNGTMFFTASDGINGDELWVSNGTPAGTVLLKDIFLGPESSHPYNLVNVSGTLYFTATDATNGRELWKSNGTAAGTVLVKDIRPGEFEGEYDTYPLGSFPNYLTNVSGTLFFTARDDASGRELWKSNGTAEGTVLVQDLIPGAGDSGDPGTYISDLTAVGGKLFFAIGNDLWVSDGTDEGTILVKEFAEPDNGYSYDHAESLGSPTNVGGVLFFAADDGESGRELWKSDGTPDGTILVADINPGPNGSEPFGLTNFNGTLFFTANDGLTGYELWKSNGTADGTMLVKDINPVTEESYGSVPFYFTNVNGTLFFTADDGTNGNELWKTDGTAAGTVMVRDVRSGTYGSYSSDLINVNGTLFFAADNGINGFELWNTDGTAIGTKLVADLRTGPESGIVEDSYDDIPRPLNLGDRLFFSATDGTNGSELWFVDKLQIIEVTLPAAGGTIDVSKTADGKLHVKKGTTELLTPQPLLSEIGGLRIIGGAGADVVNLQSSLLGFTGGITVLGNGGADKLNAGALNFAVVLDGGAGNDSLTGGSGNDNLSGGDGLDTLTGGLGTDLLDGGNDNDKLDGGGGDGDTVSGGLGNDSLNGGAGIDDVLAEVVNGSVTLAATLMTGLGTDTITGCEKGSLTGGDGDDVINASAATIVLNLNGGGGNDSITGGTKEDVIRGGTGNDTLAGAAGNDQLLGGDGNDSLSGGDGTDTVNGEAGNDSVSGGLGDDILIGGEVSEEDEEAADEEEEEDAVVESANVNFVLTDTSLAGVGNDQLIGIEHARLAGGSSSNNFNVSGFTLSGVTLLGGGGADTITGTDFDDVLDGGGGNDSLVGGLGDDVLIGGAGRDVLNGGEGDDLLNGKGDNDTLNGGAGNDFLSGDQGADSIDGGDDIDTIRETANTSLTIHATSLTGGLGTDTFVDVEEVELIGGVGNNTLTVTTFAGSVTLRGGAGNDTLVGGPGNDLLVGGDGNDVLTAAFGLNQVDGGRGIDTITETGSPVYDLAFDELLINAEVGDENFEGATSFVGVEQARLTIPPAAEGGVITAEGFAGNTTLTGGDTGDEITGGEGTDVINGGGGGDLLSGGDGNDSVNGQTGNDELDGGAGNDVIDGGADGDDLSGGEGNDSLLGGAGEDALSDDDGNDTMDGGADNDTLEDLGGNNSLLGGDGDDVIFGGADNDVLNGNGGKDSISGGDGSDMLLGGDGDDCIAGGGGSDTLTGGLGDDLITGGDVPEDGGSGIEALHDEGEFTGEEPEIDQLTETANVDFTLSENQLTGQGTDTFEEIESALITGGAGTNTLRVTTFAGSATLQGGDGKDTLIGGANRDVLLGGLGDDSLKGNGGDDELLGEAGIDVLEGGDGADCLHGDADGDKLFGQDGADTLYGGAGVDSLEGGAGDDVLLGEDGNDTIKGGADADALSGGAGNDSLEGNDGEDSILGGVGTDKILGGNDDDLLFGEDGNDTMSGDADTDTLIGGAGTNTLQNTTGDVTTGVFAFDIDLLLTGCP